MKNSKFLEIVPNIDHQPTPHIPNEENPALYYLANLSKNGRRVQKNALNLVSGLLKPGSDYLTFPWHELEYKHVLPLRALLEDKYSTATVNRILSAVRGTVKQAWILEQIPANQYIRIKQVEKIKKYEFPAGRYISYEEIESLLNVCISSHNPGGYRDAAIISCMVAGGGLRRSEIVNLDMSDYDPVSGQITITGKGNKKRTSYILNKAADALADWLALRGDHAGPLFIPINKGGVMTIRRMTGQAIYAMLQKRAESGG